LHLAIFEQLNKISTFYLMKQLRLFHPMKLVVGLLTGCAFPQGKRNNEQQYSLPVKAEGLLQNAQVQGAQ
jgi:hypothetical protein